MNVDKKKIQVEVLAPAGSLDIMKAVVTEQEDYSARVSGKFRYEAESPSDYLTAKKRKFKEIAKLNKHNYKQ